MYIVLKLNNHKCSYVWVYVFKQERQVCAPQVPTHNKYGSPQPTPTDGFPYAPPVVLVVGVGGMATDTPCWWCGQVVAAIDPPLPPCGCGWRGWAQVVAAHSSFLDDCVSRVPELVPCSGRANNPPYFEPGGHDIGGRGHETLI